MTLAEIERRLAAVEGDLAKLKSSRCPSPGESHPVDTLDAIHGTFENDHAFREAMRIGKKWRQSQNAGHRLRKTRVNGR